MTWTRVSGFAHRDSVIDGRRRIVIPLSPPPPPEWIEYFNKPVGIIWRGGKEPNRPPQLVLGAHSVVIDDVALQMDGHEAQLEYVRQLIEYANNRYEAEML